MKEIDVNMTVYDITQRYPEAIDILANLGFLGVKSPIVRNTLGRITTLKEDCKKQGKDLNNVIKVFEEKGFKVKY